MTTTERRHALLQWLRGEPHATVPAIADRFGVSARTVHRDLSALREHGVVVQTARGRGGGVRLDPASSPVTVQFSSDEIVALTLSVAMLRAAPWIPFARGAEAALRRARQALTPARAKTLRRFMARVMLGAPASDRVAKQMGSTDARLLPAFERAFREGTLLRFAYTDASGHKTTREVEPHGLLVRAPLWYVMAWDRDRDAARSFRMDRIASARVVAGTSFSARPLQRVTDALCPDAVALRR